MVTNNVYRVTLWGDENFLELESVMAANNLVNILKTASCIL